MTTLLRDFRFGLQIYAKSAWSTCIAVFTLAVGIGVTSAVFSAVNAILVKPLPYQNSERVVFPWRLAPAELSLGYNVVPWGLQEFQTMSQTTTTFESLAAFKSGTFTLRGVGEPVLVEGIRTSAGFFATLGVTPTLGRTFAGVEDGPSHEREVVLSHVLWRDRFGGDPRVLGHYVILNGYAYTVIGVMPPWFVFPRAEEMPGGFGFPRLAQLWVPLAATVPNPGDPADLAVVGLLKRGAPMARAQLEMNVFSKRMETEFPNAKGWFNSIVTPLRRQVAGDTRGPLLFMLGAAGAVLLISCSNVTNLQIAKSIERKTEFALRAALGADRYRLTRQLLAESLVLAIPSCLLGTLLVQGTVHLVKAFGPANIPRLYEVNLDARVFAFILAVTVLSGNFSALIPALNTGLKNLATSLNEGGQRTSGNRMTSRIRDMLFTGQVAIAVVLASACALLGQTYFHLYRVDPGFNAEHALTFELSLSPSEYTDARTTASLYQKAVNGFLSIPGVRAAGIVQTVPMDGPTDGTAIRIINRPQISAKNMPFANYTIASPGYFSAVGMRVLRGRDFRASDTADSIPVAVINETMAKRFWPNEEPIGQRVALGARKALAMTVVGIVSDVKHLSLREIPGPEMYVPFMQNSYPSMLNMHVVIRTYTDPLLVISKVREVVRSQDSRLPLAKVTTMREVVDKSLATTRFSMILMGLFGVLALSLASAGIYGVISFWVANRTREIGICMALGAPRSHVVKMILGRSASLWALGIAVGIVAGSGLARTMASVLYGVQPTDVSTFASVAMLLGVIALIASYLPVRRLLRVDPMNALRL